AETELARCGRREHGVDVVGRREDDADEVVLGDVVAIEHLLEQRDHALEDVLLDVFVDGGRAAEGSNVWHGRGCYRRVAAAWRACTSPVVSSRHVPGFSRRSA